MTKIVIIAAMQEEYDSMIKMLNCKHVKTYHSGTFIYQTVLHSNVEIALILSGIGKVNAAMHTQFIIDNMDPDYVINTGVAGSLSRDLGLGDVVIATDLVEYDVDATAFGLPLGQIPRMDVFSFTADATLLNKLQQIKLSSHKVCLGRIVSGDRFINQADSAKLLFEQFHALACEMEGAAIAHVCHLNKVPFAVIRTLSDLAGNDNNAEESYQKLKDVAAMQSAMIVYQLLGQF